MYFHNSALTHSAGTSLNCISPSNAPTPCTLDYQQYLTPSYALQLCSLTSLTAAYFKFFKLLFKRCWKICAIFILLYNLRGNSFALLEIYFKFCCVFLVSKTWFKAAVNNLQVPCCMYRQSPIFSSVTKNDQTSVLYYINGGICRRW